MADDLCFVFLLAKVYVHSLYLDLGFLCFAHAVFSQPLSILILVIPMFHFYLDLQAKTIPLCASVCETFYIKLCAMRRVNRGMHVGQMDHRQTNETIEFCLQKHHLPVLPLIP